MKFYLLPALLVLFGATQSVAGSEERECPLWLFRSNASGSCGCGTEQLQGLIQCNANPYWLRLYNCICMTYNKRNVSTVGSCLYTCARGGGYYFDIAVNSTTAINAFMCSEFNRKGQLCGSCVNGTAPPVFPYYTSCVNCTSGNWGKYLAITFLPVTAFFILVITFRISATSPLLNGFIICTQILTSPPNMRIAGLAANIHDKTDSQLYIMQTLTTFYGIWNLDFFRFLYTPFCLQSHTNTIQVIALDYITAIYPLMLIVLSYMMTTLYDYNTSFLVNIRRRIAPLFIRFRREWNIKSSLVNAFATFLLFSYVKILSVSVDLLMPVALYDKYGNILPELYLFNQGDIPFLGQKHLPYAFLALFFLVTFTVFPMVLLLLYPCACFQRCLNHTNCRCQLLDTFMDTFQGHYKNGSDGTRDLRFFSGLYLLLRLVAHASTVLTFQIMSFAYGTVIIGGMALTVALVQPYKTYLHNVIDAVFLAILAALTVTFAPGAFGIPNRIQYGLFPINFLLLLSPFVYITVLLACWFKSWKHISLSWHSLRQKLRTHQQCMNTYENLH